MGDIRCEGCGKPHDLSELEPSFDRPDAWFDLPEGERAARTRNTAGLCAILGTDTEPLRCFVRVVLPMPVRGESRPFCWGAWAEVAESDFARIGGSWEHPDQADFPPVPCTLANEIPCQPDGAASTHGLPGMLRLVGPREFPELTLDESLEHPFAVEQRDGIFAERLLEYLSPALHES